MKTFWWPDNSFRLQKQLCESFPGETKFPVSNEMLFRRCARKVKRHTLKANSHTHRSLLLCVVQHSTARLYNVLGKHACIWKRSKNCCCAQHASGKRSEQSEKESKTTETNQWHMIVCIYCRTDSCRSHVRATLLYVTLGVFMYFNCGMSVRKSVLLSLSSSSLLRYVFDYVVAGRQISFGDTLFCVIQYWYQYVPFFQFYACICALVLVSLADCLFLAVVYSKLGFMCFAQHFFLFFLFVASYIFALVQLDSMSLTYCTHFYSRTNIELFKQSLSQPAQVSVDFHVYGLVRYFFSPATRFKNLCDLLGNSVFFIFIWVRCA